MAAAELGGALHRREEQRRRKARREALAAEILDKHPLQNRWALWFFKNDKSQTWQANLRLVTKFSTAEDFWALYSHIQLASKLTSGCDYSLFKDGIEPMWEDNRNKRGGRWLITLAKQQRHTELDRFWLETAGVQGAAGAVPQGGDRVPGPRGHGHQERLPHQEQVCGVSAGLGSWDCDGGALLGGAFWRGPSPEGQGWHGMGGLCLLWEARCKFPQCKCCIQTPTLCLPGVRGGGGGCHCWASCPPPASSCRGGSGNAEGEGACGLQR
ncbi:eukaryotic translation initiation factor 4E type 1B isoform X1 [Chrysemys picta bellii]|uniref:eukaryotic translation initiation factor 4E type 1B isoform X1 n=1 Tax=Chrysemys picta bellii TaxID=8478 RepID=UPI0032B17E82